MDAHRVAFNTWQEKTEWVQKDKRFDVLLPWGKHRADVLKEYIDHLEARCAALLASLEAEASGRNPVLAYADSYRDMANQGVESIPVWSVITDLERNIAPLFTAPPAPTSVPAAMEMDDDFDSSFEHGKAVGWNAYRAAMLQCADGNSPVIPESWVACSERMPENKPGSYEYLVFEVLNNRVQHDYWNVPDAGDDCQFTPFWNHYGRYVTHWMPLPTAPQQE